MRVSWNKVPTVAVAALFWLIAGTSLVEAQQQPGTTGSTTGGTTGTDAGVTVGGTGTSALGGQGGSLTGQGVQQPQFRAFGDQQNQNTSGFVGRGTSDGFVGQQSAGQQTVGGAFGSQFGGFGGNQGTANRGTGQTSTRSRAERLRPRHRVAFSYVPVSSETVRSHLQARMRPLHVQGRLSDAQFSLADDGTLTLRGAAASIDDRELAAAVARLEPGVRRIDNQIVVPQAANTSTAPSPDFP